MKRKMKHSLRGNIPVENERVQDHQATPRKRTMNNSKIKHVLAGICTAGLTGFALLTAGCDATTQGGATYSRGQAQTAMDVFYGTILRVEDVTIEAKQSGVGALGGAVAGGVVGSTIGGGSGKRLAATGGALIGAATGSAAEKAGGTKPGVEIEVELDDGRMLVVTQDKDDVYAVGDRVRVVQAGDGTTRVRQ